MPYATLAICDLNAAVAAKDKKEDRSNHTEVCLLAQFAKRVSGKAVTGSTCSAAMLEGEGDEYNFQVDGVKHLVFAFDLAFSQNPHNIAEIRRQLPLDVYYEHNYEI
jgi:hypothetical protein